jgi:acetate kinase
MGCILDEDKNQEAIGKEMKISAPESKIDVFVIPTNEELMIARDTYHLVSSL